MAGVDAHVRESFIVHVKDLNRAMQKEQPLLKSRSPSGGSVKEGYDALLVSFLD